MIKRQEFKRENGTNRQRTLFYKRKVVFASFFLFLFLKLWPKPWDPVTVLNPMQFDCSSHIPQKILCRTAFEVKITILRGSSQLIGSNRTVQSDFQNYNESLSLNPFFFFMMKVWLCLMSLWVWDKIFHILNFWYVVENWIGIIKECVWWSQ